MSKSKHLRPLRDPPGWCGLCNKRRYPCEGEARRAIAVYVASGLAAEHPRAGDPIEAYRCRRGFWHFGHGVRGKRRRA
jgi:hypothetical protein